jgi:hypothetical protein
MRRSVREAIVGFTLLAAVSGSAGLWFWIKGISLASRQWTIQVSFADAAGLARKLELAEEEQVRVHQGSHIGVANGNSLSSLGVLGVCKLELCEQGQLDKHALDEERDLLYRQFGMIHDERPRASVFSWFERAIVLFHDKRQVDEQKSKKHLERSLAIQSPVQKQLVAFVVLFLCALWISSKQLRDEGKRRALTCIAQRNRSIFIFDLGRIRPCNE